MQTKTASEPSTQAPIQEPPEIPGEEVLVGAQQLPHEALEPLQLRVESTPEPSEEDALYVLDSELSEESGSIEAIAPNEIKESVHPADPVSAANLPFPVPREICLHIFSFLNTLHLQNTARVSRQSYALSAEIRKRNFLKKFSKSHWWKFLVSLADNVPGEGEKKFVDVLILGMSHGVRIPDEWRERNATLSAYMIRWMGRYPDKLQHLGFAISGYEDIQKKARALLAFMCPENDRTQFNACTSLNECVAIVEDKNKIALCQQYHDLDRLFACLILFEFISGEQPNERLNFLIRTSLARGLTGEGLIALECQFQGIFPALVREAIRLFQIPEKQEADLDRLKAIERLLGRLTEADIVRYIDTEAHGPKFTQPPLVQRQIFTEILQSNYEFMMDKMTYPILVRAEHTVEDPNKFESLLLIPHIINSQFILSRLKPEELLSMLKILRQSQVAMVINDHPVLQTYCTVEIMEELLKAETCDFEVARVFLSNKTLLDKISDDHVVAFAGHLGYSHFEYVLDSAAMQARLQADLSNSLLIKLTKVDKGTCLGRYVFRKPSISYRLTADQTIELFYFNMLSFAEPLMNNVALMDKLSSPQLLALILDFPIKPERSLVQNRLHKFTKSDLIQLVKVKVSASTISELGIFLLDSLPAEIDRRVSQDIEVELRLDSEALCELGCAHHQLGCYILEHHGERVNTNEFLLIRDHYPLSSYDSNTPIRIAIAKERERRLEIFERNAKAAETKSLSRSTSPSPPITTRKSSTYLQENRKDPDEVKLPPLVTDEEWSWAYYILKLMCIMGAVFGLVLAISGIGSAAGVGIISSVAHYLFASLTMTQGIVAGILGLSIVIASSVGWLMTDEAETARFGAKNNSDSVENQHAAYNPQFNEHNFGALKSPHGLSARKDNSSRKQIDSSGGVSEDDRGDDYQSVFNMNNQ